MALRPVLVGVFVGLAIAAGGIGVYLFVTAQDESGVTADSLADSVQEKAPGSTFTSCSKKSERRWECESEGETSNMLYLVNLDGDGGCWSAVSKDPNGEYNWGVDEPLPQASRSLSGCVDDE